MTSAVDQKLFVDDAFSAENDCDIRLPRCGRDIGPSTLEEHPVRRRHLLARSSITRQETLGKADDVGAFACCFGNGLFDQTYRLPPAFGKPDVCERDPTGLHLANLITPPSPPPQPAHQQESGPPTW